MAKLVTNGGFYVVAAAEKGARPEMVYWDECPSGFKFCSGVNGEEVYHIVYNSRKEAGYKDIHTPFLCVVSHTKNSTYPSDDVKNNGSNAKWKAFNTQALIATDLMLARKILAGEIDVESLTVNKLSTAGKNSHIEIEDGLMKVYGISSSPNIVFGVDDNGQAVLSYYNNDGVKLYDLGPNGISKVDVVEQKWTPIIMSKVNKAGTTQTSMLDSAMSNRSAWQVVDNNIPNTQTYYKFTSKRVAGVIDSTTAQYDGMVFSGQSFNNPIDNGWYIEKMYSFVYNNPIKGDVYETPSDLYANNPPFSHDDNYIVRGRQMIYYQGGKQTATQYAYWSTKIDSALT